MEESATSLSPSLPRTAAATGSSAATDGAVLVAVSETRSGTGTQVTGTAATTGTPFGAGAANSAGLGEWSLNASPPESGIPTSLAGRIAPADVIAFASPARLFPMRNIGLQCQGANATLVDVPTQTQQVDTASGARVTRFGTAGAGASADPVFRLELGAADVLRAGTAPRCELMAYPMPGSSLPVGEAFWFTASLWVDDWSGSTDKQIIGQMHIQDSRNILLNPFFALVVRGTELSVELRHNSLQQPSQSTTKLVTAAVVTLPTRRWFTVAIRARMGTDAAQAPFVQVWLDDLQIVDYVGPWGYVLQPGAAAYAKVGLYHWLEGNPWDASRPTRSMMMGSMLLARDGASGYDRSQIAAAVATPVP